MRSPFGLIGDGVTFGSANCSAMTDAAWAISAETEVTLGLTRMGPPSPMTHEPDVQGFFDEPTNTVTYLVSDPATGVAAIIDPVLNYEHCSGKVSAVSADAVLAAAEARKLTIEWILETHAHADHLTAAPYLRERTGARVGIGEHIRDVQTLFRPVFNLEDVSGEGSEFDHLFREGETFPLGKLSVEVLHTPGHTPACVSYRVGNNVFVGDTLFMPDYGTARTDFPGGSAEALYNSIQRLLALPDDTRLFMCHDYKAPGRSYFAWQTTVMEERERNVHVHRGVSEADFVAMRKHRDATLSAPLLLLPSIQVNIRAGRLPRADSNGVRYLKIPLSLDERCK
jgi:glyoxylase-like metal-dependent hydrolase (beta-lactamase superfamily II)